MKIVFVSGNLSNGGAQRVISIIASRLAERGCEVSLLLFCRSEKEYPISDKIKVRSFCKSYEEYSQMPKMARITCLKKFIKEIKPDVAVGFTEGGYALYLASFGMNFKKIASARIDPKLIMEDQGLRAMINRHWFYRADAVVLQTEGQLGRVPMKLRKKSLVIPNPISEAALQDSCTSDYEKCRRIVMVGRLDEQKNYPMAFQAIDIVRKKFSDVHLDIFGKGELEEELLQLIERMDLSANVSLRGWTQDVLTEYRNHDLYLLTSDYEGMPNALMEAMAAGIPCISTDCATGPSDLITDGENGYLVSMGDAETLAEKIICIIEMSAEERKRIGEKAFSTLRDRYNIDVIVKKWEELFEKLSEGNL